MFAVNWNRKTIFYIFQSRTRSDLVNIINSDMELLLIAMIGLLLYNLGRILAVELRRVFPRDLDRAFKAMDKFSATDYKKVRLLHKNVVFINKPQLIQKVLASDVCLEKPQLIYKLLMVDYSLLASKCEL